MAKAARYDTPAPQTGTVNYVAQSFTNRVRAWTPLAAKLGLFFAVWVGGAYLLNAQASNVVASQLSAVAFWFGWLFAIVSFLAIVGMLLTGVVHDLRYPVK